MMPFQAMRLRAAAGGSSGGGGSTLDAGGLTGLTFAWAMNESGKSFKGGTSTSGAPTADGDAIARIDSKHSIARTFFQSGNAAIYRPTRFGSSLAGAQWTGNKYLSLYTTPSAGNLPGSTQTAASLFAAGGKTIILAGRVDNASTSSDALNNEYLLADNGRWVGLNVYKIGSNAILQFSNYTGSLFTVTRTVALGAGFVVACRHDGSTIEISLDGNTWATLASGNTGSLAGTPRMCAGSTLDASIAAMVTCNAHNSNAAIRAVMEQMATMVGITI